MHVRWGLVASVMLSLCASLEALLLLLCVSDGSDSLQTTVGILVGVQGAAVLCLATLAFVFFSITSENDDEDTSSTADTSDASSDDSEDIRPTKVFGRESFHNRPPQPLGTPALPISLRNAEFIIVAIIELETFALSFVAQRYSLGPQDLGFSLAFFVVSHLLGVQFQESRSYSRSLQVHREMHNAQCAEEGCIFCPEQTRPKRGSLLLRRASSEIASNAVGCRPSAVLLSVVDAVWGIFFTTYFLLSYEAPEEPQTDMVDLWKSCAGVVLVVGMFLAAGCGAKDVAAKAAYLKKLISQQFQERTRIAKKYKSQRRGSRQSSRASLRKTLLIENEYEENIPHAIVSNAEECLTKVGSKSCLKKTFSNGSLKKAVSYHDLKAPLNTNNNNNNNNNNNIKQADNGFSSDRRAFSISSDNSQEKDKKATSSYSRNFDGTQMMLMEPSEMIGKNLCTQCGAEVEDDNFDDNAGSNSSHNSYPDIDRTSPQAQNRYSLFSKPPQSPPPAPPVRFQRVLLCASCKGKTGSQSGQEDSDDGSWRRHEFPSGKLYGTISQSVSTNISPKHRKSQACKWKKGALIGQGGFGKVHIGLNTATGELMAVKNIQFNRMDPDIKTKLAKIQLEIQTMKTLDHPNIVKYFFTERSGDSMNIFMEYVPGGSLSDLLTQFGALSVGTTCYYTRQILIGVRYLHSQSIIHRDIKGANILITVGGECKLGDFGAATLLGGLQPKRKSIVGTPMWMAPEVIMQNEYTESVDIWSLGATILEMLTGAAPFAYLFETQIEYLTMVSTAQKDTVFVLPECVDGDKDLTALMRSCLQFDAAARPSALKLLLHPWILKAVTGMESDTETEGGSEVAHQQNAVTMLGLVAGDDIARLRFFYSTWLKWVYKKHGHDKRCERTVKLRAQVQSLIARTCKREILASYYNRLWLFSLKRERLRLEKEYNENQTLDSLATPEDGTVNPLNWTKLKSCRTFKRRKDSEVRIEQMQSFLLNKAIPVLSSVPGAVCHDEPNSTEGTRLDISNSRSGYVNSLTQQGEECKSEKTDDAIEEAVSVQWE